MPELPEVEFARRTLARGLEGAVVSGVRGNDPRVAPAGPRGLEALVGARGVRVERRGKWLRMTFSADGDGASALRAARSTPEELLVFAHLGMSGRWALEQAGEEPLPHERVRLDLTRPGEEHALVYVDTRRFGRVLLARSDIEAWRELGPDPVSDGIDPRALHAALHARRRTVKEALLDQRILAGVGNIHATEALWRARIDPRSRTDALTLADVRALARGVRATLAFGLRLQGGDEVSYVHGGAADEGAWANPYRIYDRKGPCPRCRHPLAKIVLGGRGTTFCPGCQRRIARTLSRRPSSSRRPSRSP